MKRLTLLALYTLSSLVIALSAGEIQAQWPRPPAPSQPPALPQPSLPPLPRQFTLNVNVSGNGAVAGAVPIACPGICNATYLEGVRLALTAIPKPDYLFAGWSGACSGTGPCALTMNQNHNVTATFVRPPANSDRSGELIGPPKGEIVMEKKVVLATNTSSQTISPGHQANFAIDIKRTNFTGSVSLSATVVGSAGGVRPSVSVSPTPTNGNNSALVVSNTVEPGRYTLQISGAASGVNIDPLKVTLTIEQLLAAARKQCNGGNSSFIITNNFPSATNRFRLNRRQSVTLRWDPFWSQCQNYPWNVTNHRWFIRRVGSSDRGIEVNTARELSQELEAGEWEIYLAETITAPGYYSVVIP